MLIAISLSQIYQKLVCFKIFDILFKSCSNHVPNFKFITSSSKKSQAILRNWVIYIVDYSIQSVRKKVSNILTSVPIETRKKKKKSHKPWSRIAYFLSYVHLFSDSRRLEALEVNSLCHPSERWPDTTGARAC
ncbi:hypothetical protein C0J52_08319 [Blattella germanica]|nr:hypothetical protein C0J52_08319 [Blattella germanica]